jgi:hypothetical protein
MTNALAYYDTEMSDMYKQGYGAPYKAPFLR